MNQLASSGFGGTEVEETMKYQEFQVWFHAYTGAYNSAIRREKETHEYAKRCAEDIAEDCLDMFKNVEPEKIPADQAQTISNLQGVIESAVKERLGNVGKSGKKR